MKSNKKNIIEKIINFLLNILIVIFSIILLISIYTGVQTKIFHSDYADFFGYSIFEVQTGSMADAINAGDWIIIKSTTNPKLNDVVTYELNGEYITHRIIEVYKGTYVTRGDANNAKDDPIRGDQIIGKVVLVLSNFGIFRKTLFNPAVLISLIITLLVFNLLFRKKQKETNYFSSINKYVDKLFPKKQIKAKKVKKNSFLDDDNEIKNDKPVEVLATKIETPVKEEKDDLEKTAIYRTIPVDMDDEFLQKAKKELIGEQENIKIEQVEDIDIIEEDYEEDDLEKTSMYRVIPVDLSEIDDTFLEIARNEIKGVKQEEPKVEEEIEILEEEPKVEKNSGIDLEMLKSKKTNKKSKNVIDKFLLIKEEEIEELTKIITENKKLLVNELSIKETFINTYINVKYYNTYFDKNNKFAVKKLFLKIEKIIKEVSEELIKKYKGSDKKYKEKVEKYANIFILIANIEQANNSISEIKAKNEFYKKELMKYSKNIGWDKDKIKYIIDEIMKVQKNYIDIIEYLLKKLETNMFTLNLTELIKKDMYAVDLEHNLSFSKVYSDYIIDKTYTEGIVAEDKITVLLTLLSIQLINDMNLASFDRKYFIYIPASLYSKQKKLESLFKMIDNDYVKTNVIISLTIKDLTKNIQNIKKYKKIGYKFALVIDEKSEINEEIHNELYIVDYIFINKDNIDIEIPKELSDKVIYENIIDKIRDFGGE